MVDDLYERLGLSDVIGPLKTKGIPLDALRLVCWHIKWRQLQRAAGQRVAEPTGDAGAIRAQVVRCHSRFKIPQNRRSNSPHDYLDFNDP